MEVSKKQVNMSIKPKPRLSMSLLKDFALTFSGHLSEEEILQVLKPFMEYVEKQMKPLKP